MTRLARAEEVAPGITRLGTIDVGWFVLADGGRLTVVDAALPGYWPQLLGHLRAVGASIDDIEAVVLTHHHDDHRGNAERLRRDAGAEVWVHRDDSDAIGRSGPPPRAPVWRPSVAGYVWHLLRNGVARTPPVATASSFGDGEVLDVPGRPRVVHTPGHTPGNCALVVEARGVVFVGDTLTTKSLAGDLGPRLAPAFSNADSEQALASLDRLVGLDGVLLPAHGPPWRGDVDEAVELARSAGIR